MERRFDRLVSLLQGRYTQAFSTSNDLAFVLCTTSGLRHEFGSGTPAFEVVATNERGVVALSTMDRTRIAEAYVDGAIDVRGDLRRALHLRNAFSDHHPFAFLWRFVQPIVFGRVKQDAQWISKHYDLPGAFWETFLDARHRCYSHGVFLRDDEPLEDAMTRKLDFALEAIAAKPGDRVLDVGGAFGAMTTHAGRRGINVTSLTISTVSRDYQQRLIDQEQLPCNVVLQHFMEHVPSEKYDAIVNLGVTEHLPDYRGTLRKYQSLLKPGGRIYLDAAATRSKHNQSAFLAKHVFPGDGSCLSLHEYLAEVARSPFRLLGVLDDRHSYHLTTRAWAERLDAHEAEITSGWGSDVFRRFRLYLWGCADGFERDIVQAYRWMLELPR